MDERVCARRNGVVVAIAGDVQGVNKSTNVLLCCADCRTDRVGGGRKSKNVEMKVGG